MERERRIYNEFLAMHSQKAPPSAEPCAHVHFYRGKAMTPAEPLVSMSIDELRSELDEEAELVRWLLRQMSTYDCRTQTIVALVFDERTVLSDVLRRPRNEST